MKASLKIDKGEIFNRSTLLDLIAIIVGSALWVIAVDAIVMPNGLLSGGFTGIAIMLNYKFSFFPVSLVVFLMNIPILLWAFKEINLRFVCYSLLGVTLQSIFLELFKGMPSYTNNVLMACIFGGLIAGLGAGLIIRRRGSSGGMDVLGIVIKKRYAFSVGTVGTAFNAVIIGVSSLLYGIEIAMYTFIFIAVCNYATDKTIEGISKRYTAMIICEKPDEMKMAIFQRIHRGLTFIHGTGAFSGVRRQIIYCVVNQYELATLKQVIYDIDDKAFMTLSETTEVYGSFKKKGAMSLEALKAVEQENIEDILAPRKPKDPGSKDIASVTLKEDDVSLK
ncbi:MAG: YitT family protein [Clostridiales bacterium]